MRGSEEVNSARRYQRVWVSENQKSSREMDYKDGFPNGESKWVERGAGITSQGLKTHRGRNPRSRHNWVLLGQEPLQHSSTKPSLSANCFSSLLFKGIHTDSRSKYGEHCIFWHRAQIFEVIMIF